MNGGNEVMAILIRRRTLAPVGVLTTLLLLIALLGATHANAAVIHACVKKKNGAVRIVSAKAKCKKNETKVSWNQEGLPGKNGSNGSNGTNGANGTNGTNGRDLTSHTPLPSGQSESGFYAAAGGDSTTGYAAQGISFSQPLSASIAENHVIYNTTGVTSPHCSGFGHADPGYVCLYEFEGGGLEFLVTRDFVKTQNAADVYGFALFFTVKAASSFVGGSWTVTAA